MGCFTVLDRRIKIINSATLQEKQSSAECRDMCQVRKNRHGARQKTETSLEEGLTDRLGFTQPEQQASRIISTAACQLDARIP